MLRCSDTVQVDLHVEQTPNTGQYAISSFLMVYLEPPSFPTISLSFSSSFGRRVRLMMIVCKVHLNVIPTHMTSFLTNLFVGMKKLVLDNGLCFYCLHLWLVCCKNAWLFGSLGLFILCRSMIYEV